MLTDPDRVGALQHEREKMERTWRAPPKRGFGEVLVEAPARSPDDEAAGEDPRRRKRREAEGAKAEAGGEGASAEAAADVDAEQPKDKDQGKELPRVPPDPRAQRLHALLAKPGRGER